MTLPSGVSKQLQIMVAYIVGAEHLNSHKLHKLSSRNLAADGRDTFYAVA
jgi:hypothetical protein